MAKIFIVLALGFVIFCMGVSIGRNGDIIQALPSLGGKALLYAVLAVIGSIVAVYLLTKVFLRKGAKE